MFRARSDRFLSYKVVCPPFFLSQPASIPFLAHFEIVPLETFNSSASSGAVGDAILDALPK